MKMMHKIKKKKKKKKETKSKEQSKRNSIKKYDKSERDIGETKPQNITKLQKVTEESEKEIYMDYNKYVKTGVQCGSCYRWYHQKC